MSDTGGPPPFPASPDELHAPPSWRCIDFISDLHLHEGRPRTFEAFANYLRLTSADAVFILGDLFEAWVGDDMRHQPFEAQCAEVLAAVGQRLSLHLMVGNRDFLLGPDMSAACHARWLDDPTVLHAFGERHVLTHGDAWCLADTDYLAFRCKVRNPAWQAVFLTQPFAQRMKIAQAMREASAGVKLHMLHKDWADVDPDTAALSLTQLGATRLVHGHTHHPASEAFALPGVERHVLSDWELDEHPARAEVLRLTQHGYARLPLPLEAY